MANPAKFDRCVKKVRGKSRGRVNAYAVCTAAGTRNNPKAPEQMTAGELNKALDKVDAKLSALTQKFIDAGRGNERPFEWRDKADPLSLEYRRLQEERSPLVIERDMRYGPGTPSRLPKGFGPRKRNPEPDSADMYESFHGAPSEEILEFRESEHYHGNLAGLGILVELKLVTITGYDVTLSFSNPDTLVASNPGLWQRLKGIGSKTTVHSIATHPGKVSGTKHKGFTIYKHKEGWYRIKELDPRLSFDDVGDAKKFVDETGPVKKGNPSNEYHVYTAYINQYGKTIPSKLKLEYEGYGEGVETDALHDIFYKILSKYYRNGNARHVWISHEGPWKIKPDKKQPSFDVTREDFDRFKNAYLRQEDEPHYQNQLDEAVNAVVAKARGRATNPGPVQTSLKYLSKAGSAALKPFDSTFGKMGKYLDNKVGRALKNKKNPSMDPALLCSNESGTQLYIVGGDQSIDLSSIHMADVPEKDSMVLGECYFVSYFTTKDFDDHAPTIYEHDLAEESDPPSPKYRRDEVHIAANRRLCGTGTGCYPTVRYDNLNQHLYLDGGDYKIEKPLLGTSPGIEN